MRKSIWIPCIIILAFCLLLLFLHWPKKQNDVDTNAASVVSTDQEVTNHLPPKNVLNNSNQSNAIAPAIPQHGPTSRPITNSFFEQITPQWQVPIEFYGRVVDQSNNPVVGANIQFSWTETPMEVLEEGPGETKTTESDIEGLFALHGARGPNLDVRVSKQGYYTSRKDTWGFSYDRGRFSPDPLNPVVFHLRKKGDGAELITSENGMKPDVWVRVPTDNSTVKVDFSQKQATATGQLEIRQNKPPWRTATNWSFSLSIPGGGLIENQDEFQFEAPEGNYQSTVESVFMKSDTNWITHVTKQFYIVFGQPRKYGWLRFESDLAQETVFITYAINPDGSRNLEPK